MRYKITRKIIKNFEYRINVNELRIMNFFDSPAYASGVYGWNYDFYYYDSHTCLLKGERNIPYNLRNWKLVDKYNQLYEEIDKDKYTFSELKEIAGDLLDEFVREIKKGE